MAEQKPSEYQSKFKVLEPSSLSAGLKSSILSSASSPAISAMTKQSDDFNKSRDKSQNKGTTNFFLTVPESPLKLQNSSSSSSISSWFRTPFGSSFHLTTDIEQQAENISDASYLGNEIQLGIDMIKLSHNNLDSDNIKKPEMLPKHTDRASNKPKANQANQPQMRFNVANFDLNAVGPSSW